MLGFSDAALARILIAGTAVAPESQSVWLEDLAARFKRARCPDTPGARRTRDCRRRIETGIGRHHVPGRQHERRDRLGSRQAAAVEVVAPAVINHPTFAGEAMKLERAEVEVAKVHEEPLLFGAVDDLRLVAETVGQGGG